MKPPVAQAYGLHCPTRREFAAAAIASAAALAACRREAPAAPALVSVTRAPQYDQTLYATVREILAQHGVDARGRHVLLKPNLVEFEPASTINTHPLLVHAVFEAFRAMGAASVRIAEGPGHRRETLDMAEAAGYFQTVPGFEDLFIDLNLDDVSLVQRRHRFSQLDKLYLPNTVLAADLLVSIPKMKTHHWTAATLSMKNLFGIVPGAVYGWPKNVLHWSGIHECIADLHALFPRQFALVDGIVGMEGNGPIQGVPKAAGVLVAGADPVAVDATCCRIMRIDPHQITYLRLAGGPAVAERHIRQIGAPVAAVATRFELPPDFKSGRLELV
jgi:uncharacterized protein (DUF362 family)